MKAFRRSEYKNSCKILGTRAQKYEKTYSLLSWYYYSHNPGLEQCGSEQRVTADVKRECIIVRNLNNPSSVTSTCGV